jgi:response regulator RpfG family c-di-GMP phosphodiesterase
MSLGVAGVLAGLAASSVGLVYYVRWYLPGQVDARFRESMKAFSLAVELRFPSHQGMTARVVRLSLAVGRKLMLTKNEMRRLEMAAHLRDIGLCSMAFRLGNSKSPTDWTEAEQATYNRHPEVGGAMLELIPSLRHLANIVRCHQADFDGAGDTFFPAKDDIPVESRVINVVSSYVWDERMMGALIAYDSLVRGSGQTFDPIVVDAFRSVLTSTRVPESKSLAAVDS